MIPRELRSVYPFTSRQMILPFLPSPTNRMHYVDEGEGEVLLCLHGNPTWSFFYRRIIQEFRGHCRVIAPDHIGCGASSKPHHYSYRLADHIHNLEYFINQLGLTDITLMVHDWGGAIGLGWAGQYPQAVKRIILLNTAAFRSKDIPKRIAFCKIPMLGEFLIRRGNAFVRAALSMATAKGLSRQAAQGFTWPYNDYSNRIAIARFIQDIPLSDRHPSYKTLQAVEENLSSLACPKLILWGLRDFCFHKAFLEKWQNIYPDARVRSFPRAGHYLLEDEPKAISLEIAQFMGYPA